MWYPPQPPAHGYVPPDDQLARDGFRAFAPLRKPFEPSDDDFKRAAGDVLPDDGADEFGGVARALAAERDDEEIAWLVGGWCAMWGDWWSGQFDDT